ncbi:hypothetical protein M8818_001456 [Zalaria obscura]|uniref:Uncharacterized protein n=1 Tax=Zalaria obscura TaxID=2024903 RepID=A0ACC3SJU1_9PEZI
MRATRSTAPNVRPIDVHTATQVLGLKNDWHNFWSTAARRNHLKVYSQAERFDDGREKTQFGCLLSYDEVEAECGMATEKPEEPVGDVVPTVEEDLDLNDLLEDDDIWTEASYSGSSDNSAVDGDEAPADENSAHGSDYAPETTDYETEAEPHTQNSRRHRQVHDPRVLEKRQDMYTEALDQQMSAAEEQRLWAVLGREPPFHVKAEEAETPRPPLQRRKRRAEVEDWKDRIDFQAEWERFGETVPKEEFELVGQRGVQGRKRRRVAYDTLQQRGYNQGGQDTMDDHEMGTDQDTEQVAGASDSASLDGEVDEDVDMASE